MTSETQITSIEALTPLLCEFFLILRPLTHADSLTHLPPLSFILKVSCLLLLCFILEFPLLCSIKAGPCLTGFTQKVLSRARFIVCLFLALPQVLHKEHVCRLRRGHRLKHHIARFNLGGLARTHFFLGCVLRRLGCLGSFLFLHFAKKLGATSILFLLDWV